MNKFLILSLFVAPMMFSCASGAMEPSYNSEGDVPHYVEVRTSFASEEQTSFASEEQISCASNGESDTRLTLRELYEEQKENLGKTTLYFFINAYKEERFANYLARCLKLNKKRLDAYKVEFKIRLTCDGRQEDVDAFQKAFNDEGLTGYDIFKNERNLGVSETRRQALLNAKLAVLADIARGQNVYFAIFDSDDMIHQDYCLALLATALKTNADLVNADFHEGKVTEGGTKFEEDGYVVDSQGRQYEEKITIDLQLENDIEDCKVEVSEVDAGNTFCPEMFNAKNIFKEDFDFTFDAFREHVIIAVNYLNGYATARQEDHFFDTLAPLSYFKDFERKFSLSLNKDRSYPYMYYYVQHEGSLQHTILKSPTEMFAHAEAIIKVLADIAQGKLTYTGYEEESSSGTDEDAAVDSTAVVIVDNRWAYDEIMPLRFLFGIPDTNFDKQCRIYGDYNRGVEMSTLYPLFEHSPKLAHRLKEVVDLGVPAPALYKALTETLAHDKVQALLEKNRDNELTPEFMITHYHDLLTEIKKPFKPEGRESGEMGDSSDIESGASGAEDTTESE